MVFDVIELEDWQMVMRRLGRTCRVRFETPDGVTVPIGLLRNVGPKDDEVLLHVPKGTTDEEIRAAQSRLF